MKGGSIRLHPKHGLNPTMPLCIVCGEMTGEIALLGSAYTEEAPRSMVLGIEPCTPCRKKYLGEGVLLVEAENDWNKPTKFKDGREVPNRKPTGRIMVIKQEAFKGIFNQAVPPRQIALCEVGVLQQLQEQANQDDGK